MGWNGLESGFLAEKKNFSKIHGQILTELFFQTRYPQNN